MAENTVTVYHRTPHNGSFFIFPSNFDLLLEEFTSVKLLTKKQVSLISNLFSLYDSRDLDNSVSLSYLADLEKTNTAYLLKRLKTFETLGITSRVDVVFNKTSDEAKKGKMPVGITFNCPERIRNILVNGSKKLSNQRSQDAQVRHELQRTMNEMGFVGRPDPTITQVSTPLSYQLSLIEQSIAPLSMQKSNEWATHVYLNTNDPSRPAKATMSVRSLSRIPQADDLQTLYAMYSLTIEYHNSVSRKYLDNKELPPNATPIFSSDVIKMRKGTSKSGTYSQNFHDSVRSLKDTTYELSGLKALFAQGTQLTEGYTSEKMHVFTQCRPFSEVAPKITESRKVDFAKNSPVYIIEWPSEIFEKLMYNETTFAFPKQSLSVSEVLFMLYLSFRIKLRNPTSNNYTETITDVRKRLAPDSRLDNFIDVLKTHLVKLPTYEESELSYHYDDKTAIGRFTLWGYSGYFDFSEKYLYVEVDRELMLECCGLSPNKIIADRKKQTAPTRQNPLSQSLAPLLHVHRRLSNDLATMLNVERSRYGSQFTLNDRTFEISHYMSDSLRKDAIAAIKLNIAMVSEPTLNEFLDCELDKLSVLSIRGQVVNRAHFNVLINLLSSINLRVRYMPSVKILVSLSRKRSFHDELEFFLSQPESYFSDPSEYSGYMFSSEFLQFFSSLEEDNAVDIEGSVS